MTQWTDPTKTEDPVEPYTVDEWTPQVYPFGMVNYEVPPYIVLKKFLTKRHQKMIEAGIRAGSSQNLDYGENVRVKQVRMLPGVVDTEVYERLNDGIAEVNAVWDFNVSGWYESLIALEYNVGDFNAWHTDSTPTDRTKIGFSSVLNVPGVDFQGGDFEILKHGVIPLRVGDVLFFPGYMTHQVHPVTQGTRHTLTGWVGGPPWK